MAKRLTVQWTGLDTFEDELRLLTADLVDEANEIMLESCEAAKADIAAAYPVKSGRLRAGLVITPARGTVLAGAIAHADGAARLDLRTRHEGPRKQSQAEPRVHAAASDL